MEFFVFRWPEAFRGLLGSMLASARERGERRVGNSVEAAEPEAVQAQHFTGRRGGDLGAHGRRTRRKGQDAGDGALAGGWPMAGAIPAAALPPREAGLHGVGHDSIAVMDPCSVPPGCFDACEQPRVTR